MGGSGADMLQCQIWLVCHNITLGPISDSKFCSPFPPPPPLRKTLAHGRACPKSKSLLVKNNIYQESSLYYKVLEDELKIRKHVLPTTENQCKCQQKLC